MNKVILKTALYTLGLIIAAGLLVFSLWILISPQSMATACENTGNYSFAVTCADLRYKYTKDVSDLARCAQDGILSGKDKHVLNYCVQLIEDEDYESICAQKDSKFSQISVGGYKPEMSYNSYIRVHLAAAQYRAGEKVKALETASGGGAESFTKLVIEIVENKDAGFAPFVIEALDRYTSPDAEQLKAIILKNV